MREEPIIRSPYAYDPVKMLTMSEQERETLYAERVDETAKPYTVIDVITKVFRRDFRADLDIAVLTDESILRSLKKSDSDWEIVNYTVDGMKLLHPESVFGQPVEDFLVDIAFDARLIIHEAHIYMVGMKNTYTVRTEFRLRYTFNLSPCELTCRFVGAIMGRGNGIYNLYPEAIRLNKYLLPVLTSTDDYEKLSRKIIKEDMPRFLDSPNVFSAIDWICNMGLQVYVGSFPEQGVLGEYFFGFDNPCDFADRPKAEKYRAAYYSADELTELFKAAADSPIYIPILLTAHYALRRSEVLGMKWSNIDFRNKTVKIAHKVVEQKVGDKWQAVGHDRMKNESSNRVLPLIPEIETALLRLKKHQDEQRRLCREAYDHSFDDYICVDEMGKLIRPSTLSSQFSRLLKENGLRHIRYHDLRHPNTMNSHKFSNYNNMSYHPPVQAEHTSSQKAVHYLTRSCQVS